MGEAVENLEVALSLIKRHTARRDGKVFTVKEHSDKRKAKPWAPYMNDLAKSHDERGWKPGDGNDPGDGVEYALNNLKRKPDRLDMSPEADKGGIFEGMKRGGDPSKVDVSPLIKAAKDQKKRIEEVDLHDHLQAKLGRKPTIEEFSAGQSQAHKAGLIVNDKFGRGKSDPDLMKAANHRSPGDGVEAQTKAGQAKSAAHQDTRPLGDPAKAPKDPQDAQAYWATHQKPKADAAPGSTLSQLRGMLQEERAKKAPKDPQDAQTYRASHKPAPASARRAKLPEGPSADFIARAKAAGIPVNSAWEAWKEKAAHDPAVKANDGDKYSHTFVVKRVGGPVLGETAKLADGTYQATTAKGEVSVHSSKSEALNKVNPKKHRVFVVRKGAPYKAKMSADEQAAADWQARQNLIRLAQERK